MVVANVKAIVGCVAAKVGAARVVMVIVEVGLVVEASVVGFGVLE